MDQEEASGPTLPHSTFGCNIMVKLKVFLFIPYFCVSLNSKNSCSIWCTLFIYILKKKKKFKISKSFPKKREKFSNKKKSLDYGHQTLKSYKKIIIIWTRGIGIPSDFFKKAPFFFLLSKISRFFKVFFSKWYMRIPWTNFFLNLWCSKAWTINLYRERINFIWSM